MSPSIPSNVMLVKSTRGADPISSHFRNSSTKYPGGMGPIKFTGIPFAVMLRVLTAL